MSKNKVCIVLPCYKVKDKIYTVYKKLIIKKFDCLIFVDDKCPEKSVAYLKSKIKKNKRTKFIFLEKNLGVGGATLKGFKLARKQGYKIIVKFDSDNQHKISDLSKIIKLLKKKEVAFCKGYRNLNFRASFKRKMPLIRILGASALTYISRLTTKNFNLKDVTNGLFGMKSEILNLIKLKKVKKNYFFEQDLIFRICRKNIKIFQVNSEVIYADEKSNLNTLGSIFPFLIYHFQNFFYKD
jgi:GT2 family glycosyltransferase